MSVLSALCLVEKGGEVRHSCEDPRASGRTQSIGVTIRAVAAAAKPDDRHSGGDRSLDAGGAVFDDDAALRRRSQPPRREQEEVGGGLAGCDLNGTEDRRVEKAQQAGYRQPLADPLEMAVRGDAARQGQGVEQLLDAGGRLQLALQDPGP